MSKRFLNVEYNNAHARIDTKDMEDISQVQKCVEEWYSKDFPEVTALKVQLWIRNATENTLIEDLDEISDEFYLKRKKGGLSLTIVLLPSPTTSRHASETSLVAGMGVGHLI